MVGPLGIHYSRKSAVVKKKVLDIGIGYAIVVSMSNPAQEQNIKVGILNLNNLLKKYKPELKLSLVNESNEHGWTGKYLPIENAGTLPTFDQLLNTCYHAMRDITQFIAEHEKIKTNLLELQQDATTAHRLLLGAGLSVSSLEDGVGIILSRFKQSIDVVYKASTIHPHGLAKFQTAAREFVLRFLGKDKANDLYGGEAGSKQSASDKTPTKGAADGETTGGADNPVGK